MQEFELRYGRGHVTFGLDAGEIEVASPRDSAKPLTDAEIGDRFDNPIGSPPVDEIVHPGDRVLIVVPDATRQTASGQIVNLLVRRLIACGIDTREINIIFATGIHRPVTEAEKSELLTPFIAQRIRTLQHDPKDRVRLFSLGETSGGIPVELNWALTEYENVIIVGGITFHYFAGFTGGRKLVCPGLASERTIAETHRLSFDPAALDRREGVGPGLLAGNPVHEAFVEAASKARISFAINTVVNDAGEAVEVTCGHWLESHYTACKRYSLLHDHLIDDRFDTVIVSAGGYPFDINFIQAYKALEAAASGCRPGGTIVLAAECQDGPGRDDLLQWFDAGGSREIAERLREDHRVNGQTAWSMAKKAETFDVRIVTALDDAACRRMGIRRFESVENALGDIERNGRVLLMPHGAKVRVISEDENRLRQ